VLETADEDDDDDTETAAISVSLLERIFMQLMEVQKVRETLPDMLYLALFVPVTHVKVSSIETTNSQLTTAVNLEAH
jgi:hypothetical protein